MGWLEDPLQVRRIALDEGELFGQPIERDSPAFPRLGAHELEEPVDAARNR